MTRVTSNTTAHVQPQCDVQVEGKTTHKSCSQLTFGKQVSGWIIAPGLAGRGFMDVLYTVSMLRLGAQLTASIYVIQEEGGSNVWWRVEHRLNSAIL